MSGRIQLNRAASLPDMVENFRAQILGGDVDPLRAYAQLNLLAKAADMAMKDPRVLDIALSEFSKYNQREVVIGDCRIEQVEAGVKYDYSGCCDSRLEEAMELHAAMAADIKERQEMLRHIPTGGMADPETGEVVKPPVKTSKTTLKITFNKN